ncbi:hypothetical protein [Devriesea agamarum]|uniref:hypothetical protein n=1 Tax=Devriesea agamarum TaxID=472569 RepID=UPI00071E1D13|nr:hypothetical protein [Devriesea agamarum]
MSNKKKKKKQQNKSPERCDFKRVTPKRYPLVYFTYPEVYGDAVFAIPNQASLSAVELSKLINGDLPVLIDLLKAANVDKAMIDAVSDLSISEMEKFATLWTDASQVDLGKSSQ